jgi:hypothetical protein
MNILVQLAKQDRVEADLPKDAQKGQYLALRLGKMNVWVSRESARKLATEILDLLDKTPQEA